MSTAAAGGRRNSASSSSTDAESAQWKSSSTSTSGLPSAQAARAARAPRGGCDSARAGRDGATVCEGGQRGQDVRGASACTSSSRVADRLELRLSTYSSSACTKTENGSSRSSSDADPERTRCPRSSQREASSASTRLADARLAHQFDCSRRPALVHRAAARANRARRRAPRAAQARAFVLLPRRAPSILLLAGKERFCRSRRAPHQEALSVVAVSYDCGSTLAAAANARVRRVRGTTSGSGGSRALRSLEPPLGVAQSKDQGVRSGSSPDVGAVVRRQAGHSTTT